jgi:signal transduction histidine kinase
MKRFWIILINIFMNKERHELSGALKTVGAVCHNLNQPLQAIMGNAELLQITDDPVKIRQYTDTILVQVRRAGDYTAGLMDDKVEEYLLNEVLNDNLHV